MPELATVEYTDSQIGALDAIKQWYMKNEQQVFYLAGHAGTGKTTLAAHIPSLLGIEVGYAAYTGKAASVLRRKGCEGARTLHSWIYAPRGETSKAHIKYLKSRIKRLDPDSQSDEVEEIWAEIRQQRRESKRGWELIPNNGLAPMNGIQILVLDEVSMIDEKIANDLLSYGTRVIVLGDTHQLPPIARESYFNAKAPDWYLDEIHRFALESPIYRYSEAIRLGGVKAIEKRRDGNSSMWPKKRIKDIDAALKWADQVIVWTNEERINLNTRMRDFLGYGADLPEPGERLICLQNNPNYGIHNGEQFHVVGVDVGNEHNGHISMYLQSEDGREIEIPVWTATFAGVEGEAEILKDLEFKEQIQAGVFTYAYAVTCHKAQGSQWGKVLVFDSSRRMRYFQGEDFARRWLYTAITRAENDVVVLT